MKTIFLILLSMSSAFAMDPSFELEEDASNLSSVLAENEVTLGKAWFADVIRIRTVLEFGIEVPVIAKFSVNPEVEFFFSKK